MRSAWSTNPAVSPPTAEGTRRLSAGPDTMGRTGKALSVRCHSSWQSDTRPSRLLRKIGAMKSVDQSVSGRNGVHERSCESLTCGDLHDFVPVVYEAGSCLRRTLQCVSAGITMRDTNHPGMQLTRLLFNLFGPHEICVRFLKFLPVQSSVCRACCEERFAALHRLTAVPAEVSEPGHITLPWLQVGSGRMFRLVAGL